MGLGEAVGAYLLAAAPAHANLSVTAAAARLGIPLTVHVAIGTDIIHMHPDASGAAIGETSLRDFRRFVSNVSRLAGGAYLNCGSAVVLPEVFLKAVSLVRNRGISLDGLVTVNLDFVRLYRPQTNVVQRPTAGIGRGYSLVGHHELLIPLLALRSSSGADRGQGLGDEQSPQLLRGPRPKAQEPRPLKALGPTPKALRSALIE